MTECIAKQLIFSFIRKRQLTVDFEGGEITSDAGLRLIQQADNNLNLTMGIAGCIKDGRDSRYSDHSMVDMLRQRILWKLMCLCWMLYAQNLQWLQ